ncbi:MAG: aldehyde dehydrogenase family protein, partial [Planctomycetales bacterium]|nr:aldehyde dehydrogenase family protein [Planctomycetales bacterium]
QLKPAVGTEEASSILCDCFYDAGVPGTHLELLDSSTSAATDAIDLGVDMVVLTGAAETGRKVLSSAAPRLSASIMELSGCDAVIVLPGADLERLTRAVQFGLEFNGSATCIGPRRLLVSQSQHGPVIAALKQRLADEVPVVVHPAARHSVSVHISSALECGAIDVLGRFSLDQLRDQGIMYPTLLDRVTSEHSIASADVFAPVLSIITVTDIDHAVRLVNDCPYRLAASVFGPAQVAGHVAARLDVGTVTVNDLIAPTADPRLPFGGRGQSGFGVTRGPEGLLAMTAVKVVSTRRGSVVVHLRPRSDSDEATLHGALKVLHGSTLSKKIAGLRRMVALRRPVGGVKKVSPDGE